MKNYHIKAYSWQVSSWKNRAEQLGMSVSDWVRTTLNSVACDLISPNFIETKMNRGNDPERDEIAESFQFRVESSWVDVWNINADNQGLSIGEWCRQCLDYAVEKI